MFLRKYIIAILLLITGFKTSAQQNNIYTLQQCLDTAVKYNLQVQQGYITAETDRIGYVQAKDNIFPTAVANVSRELTTGRSLNPVTNTYFNQSVTSDNYSLQSNVILFNGLAYQSAIKQASLAYQSGKMNYQAAKDIVTVNVITNYLTVLDQEEQLAQTKSQLLVAQEGADRGEILEKEGANKAESDVFDLRGSLEASKVNVVNAQNTLNSAMLTLFQLMNIPYNKDVQLQQLNAQDLTGDKDVTPDQVYQTGLQQLAVVKAATLMRESAEKGVKYYRGLLYPTVSLGGGIGTNYSNSNLSSYGNQFQNNYGTYIQLGLNIPIFTNHLKKNALALAKINLLNYQYLEENTRVTLRQNVEQAYYNMAAAYNKYQALDKEVQAYDESFRISKIRFEAGVLTSVDYITYKDKMDAANLNLISARYDYFIYSKILDYYQGKLSFQTN
jgi:outer membrane protein